MESSSTATGAPPEQEAFTFRWKDHSEGHQPIGGGSNYAFQCKYCKKQIKGAKTRLVDHFISTTMKCHACPEEVADGLREERRLKEAKKQHRKRVMQQEQQIDRESKSIRMQELARSFHSGASKPTSKVRQSTIAECEAAKGTPNT